MASLEKRNETYRIVFMYGGKRHGFSLGTGDRREAESLAGGAEKVLMRLEQKLLKLPPGVDIVDFVRNDGQVDAADPSRAVEPITFAKFRDRYLATHEGGAMESNSLGTVRIHLGHFAKTLGERFPMATLSASDLQSHIDRHALMKGARGKRLSPTTIKKELASFRAAWNWAVHMGLVVGIFLNRGLVRTSSLETSTRQAPNSTAAWLTASADFRSGGRSRRLVSHGGEEVVSEVSPCPVSLANLVLKGP